MKTLLITLILFFTCSGISAPISANGTYTEVGKVESAKILQELVLKPEEPVLDTLSLTKDNVFFVIKALGLHHEDVVMKQAILETGHFKSLLAKKGNLFGLRGRKGYYHYRHWSESVIAYRDKIQSRYKEGEDYYKFLRRIKYCESSDYEQKLKKV